jgi:hypothetical protein
MSAAAYAIATLLEVADYEQTARFTQHQYDLRRESNPIIGPRPSRAQLNRVFIASNVLTFAVPTKYQWAIVGAEAVCVTNNGVKLKWRF